MSPSPKDLSDKPAVDAYATAWKAIMKSARSGNSWSGSEANRTFLNTGGGKFADVSYICGLAFKDDGRAMAVTDWDEDGDLDLWTYNRTAPRLRLMRNNTAAESRSVSFLLAGGQKSNRDAIGARLDLVLSDGSVLVQTLRAGNGFLSQSSKWLHFGLGANTTPESLRIRWPDGRTESFANIPANARCRIVQGGGLTQVAARKIPLPAANHARPAELPEPPLQGILPGKIPLPEFQFTPAGSTNPVALRAGDKPLFILLFSGSCTSCAKELAEITNGEKRIRSSHVEVLALSIDGLAADTSPSAGDEWLRKSAFPFSSGAIASTTADHLRFLLQSLYDYPAPFSVPLGLLLDEERRLFAVYRGLVSPELFLRDAEFSKANSDQLRDLAVPFPGRWFTDSITPSALAELVASPFLEVFPLQGLRYLEYAMATAPGPDQKERLRRQISHGYHALARQEKAVGNHRTAETYFEATIALDPNKVESRIDYGALLGNQGKLSAAEAQFRRALELDPENGVAKKNLELLLGRQH
ncbi:MAG: ASPIC/UnbV domain-containing protein [Verrucomicrobiales bacterium]